MARKTGMTSCGVNDGSVQCYSDECTVEDKKTFPFGISRTMLLRGVSLTFYVNGRLKTVIERS